MAPPTFLIPRLTRFLSSWIVSTTDLHPTGAFCTQKTEFTDFTRFFSVKLRDSFTFYLIKKKALSLILTPLNKVTCSFCAESGIIHVQNCLHKQISAQNELKSCLYQQYWEFDTPKWQYQPKLCIVFSQNGLQIPFLVFL